MREVVVRCGERWVNLVLVVACLHEIARNQVVDSGVLDQVMVIDEDFWEGFSMF